MSGSTVFGKARLPQPLGPDEPRELPLSETTSAVLVELVAGGVIVFSDAPTSILYSSAAAENVSAIPGAVFPASLTAIYARLLSTAAASRWVQIHLGPVAPIAGAVPFLVGDIITPPGGNTQWVPPGGIVRPGGFFVVTSTTEDVYTVSVALEMITRALGRP